MIELTRMTPILWSVALGCALVGCGSSDSSLSDAQSRASYIESGGERIQDQSADPIDVCSLLSEADISAVLGVTVSGVQTGSGCEWEDPAFGESVTLRIGTGTAENGTIPPMEPGLPDPYTPGPDGMRILAGAGSVEFVAGGLINEVAVAVLREMSSDDRVDAAIELARKVTPQLPG